MYIPTLNQMTDKVEIVGFMKRFSFATIVSVQDHVPVATHLPFLVALNGDHIRLTSHFAKANGQWKNIEEQKVLVIFSEPHAYISPKHYDKELSVPTWNYISIHAYGNVFLISDADKVMEVLESTIDNYETSYRQQWNKLPEDFKSGMIKGIVAFEVSVTEIQAKKKLSQNKTETEQQRIIETLSGSHDTNEQIIADYMKQMNRSKSH